MAAGFKQATVNASSVPSTQSNFPAYVDLSRLGITTLAEAQSVRVYSDEAKTTELAREIVSVTEMHVKIPSLTSTFVLYVDWDGSSADYAATDTYGRNAVWSDYARVYHLQETSGAVIDSTGNDDGTNNGATTGATGQIDNAYDFDGSNDYISGIASVGSVGADITMSAWYKADAFSTGTNQRDPLVYNYGGSSNRILMHRSTNTGRIQIDTYDGTTTRSNGVSSSDTTSWHHFVATSNTSKSLTTYLDTVAGSASTYLGGNNANGVLTIGGWDVNTSYLFDGKIDEVRIRLSILSANWITTEYNNQSAESTFWGTWTDAGGGGGSTFIPKVIFMN